MLSPRRLAATAASLGALVFAALVLLALTGVLDLGAAAATAAFLIALAALAFLVMSVRRLDGKAQRIDQRVKKHDAELATTAATLKRIESQLEQLSRAMEASAARGNDDLSAILASLGEDRVNAMVHAREVEELRAEVRALAKDPV